MDVAPIRTVFEHDSPLGPMWSCWTARGLYRLGWASPEGLLPVAADRCHANDLGSDAKAFDLLLRRYFEDGVESFSDVTVDPTGWSPFTARVYQHCRKIIPGQTRRYQQIAQAAGNPGASRAVGAAMARNRVLLVIPCHRVVSAGGALRGFSAPGGLSTKRWLLGLERQDVRQGDLFANV